MSDLRTAAQQALEALYEADTFHRNLPDQRVRRLAAMAALRAALAQQDEPLNLRDPAVRKRLATQWGYVPAAQAEPVEPVATLIAQRDALLEALKQSLEEAIYPSERLSDVYEKARAAIKAVEGEKT